MIPEQTLSQAVTLATELRHRLHQIPELLFEEHQTAQAVRHQLTALGIPFTAGVENAPTATIGLIGDPAKPCIALRADIDALPIQEENDLPFRSKNNGCMHACGHDGHTSILMGAASILKTLDLPICIKLIFQPAEEAGGGAGRLVQAGVLDGRIGPKPQVIFGLHVWPGLPQGLISTKPGPLLAATDNFLVTFRGRGSHGAYPHISRDPVVATCEAVLSLQAIVSREIDPIDSAVITVGRISGGTAANIIPESMEFEGTMRTLKPETRKSAKEAMYRRLQGIAAAHDMKVEVNWTEGYPPTVNHPDAAEYVKQIALQTFSPNGFMPSGSPSMGGEDFAYYLEQIPGCFILVGLRPPDVKTYTGLHNPRFLFNDAAMPNAIRLLVELALNWKPK